MFRDATAKSYLTPPDESFWEWRDDARVVTWRDGKTIAFREEIAQVLEQLVPTGLPRFGSLLLLLAATRDGWGEDNTIIGLLCGMLPRPTGQAAVRSRDLLVRAAEGLEAVSRLPPDLRSDLAGKRVLAERIFEDCEPVVPSDAAAGVVAALRPGLAAVLEARSDSTRRNGALVLLKDLAALATRLERVDAEALRRRARTGLDETPGALAEELLAPPEPTIREASRRAIRELLESPEHRGVGLAAQRLMASVSIPRPITTNRENEEGGYSDIANRGDPDRLLLSELAQDSLVLAVRVAMNEALYLRREAPPSQPLRRREVLIDSGVWSWGAPRALAASTALAVAATAAGGVELGAWRGDGERLSPVDLTSVGGVIEHLSQLSDEPDLSRCLGEFATRLDGIDEAIEAIVIAPTEALGSRQLMHALAALPAERVVAASVGRDGCLKLIELRPRFETTLREARVDLAQVLARPDAVLRRAGDLPAILRVDPFPLRLAPNCPDGRSWMVGDRLGAMSVTTDGRLLHWDKADAGAVQIADTFTEGHLRAASRRLRNGSGEPYLRFVYGTRRQLAVYTANLATMSVESASIRVKDVTDVVFHHGDPVVLTSSGWTFIDSMTGEGAGATASPAGYRHRAGRYFCDSPIAGEWLALACDGPRPVFEPVPRPEGQRSSISGLWDVEGCDGPMAITPGGAIFGLSDGHVRMRCGAAAPLYGARSRASDWRLDGVSPDGLFVRVKCDYGDVTRTLSADLTAKRMGFSGDGLVDGRLTRLVRPRQTRNRFQSIGVLAGNPSSVVLRSNKGKLVAVTANKTAAAFRPVPGSEMEHEVRFEPIDGGDRRYRLAEAVWPDGSRAVLDSRGLLHLASSDSGIGEVTLILSEGELSGWYAGDQGASAGCFGRKAFAIDSLEPPSGGSPSARSSPAWVGEHVLRRFTEAIHGAH